MTDSVAGREKKPTDKGIQYQLDVKTKNWKGALRHWKRTANKLREILVKENVEMSTIKDSRDCLQECMDKAIIVQESLAEVTASMKVDDDSEEKLDEIEEEHSSLMKDTLRTLIRLRGSTSSSGIPSHSSKEKKKCQEWVDHSTTVASVNQEHSSKKAENLGDSYNVGNVVEVESNPICEGADKAENTSNVKSTFQEATKISSLHKDDVSLSGGLMELLRMNRLPIPEPGTFGGDPLEYTSWKRSYNALIEHRGIPVGERFYFLLKYLEGEPKSLVQGYSMLGDDTAYYEAMKVLEERYGDPFIISNAFRNKLDAWPKVGTKDSAGLRRLGDFLRQCCTASKYVHHLHHLDDERENRKLMNKLPDWLSVRWCRTVVKWRQDMGIFPPFSAFAGFVNEEAAIACDPIASFQAPIVKERRQTAPNARSFSTGAQSQKQIDNRQRMKRTPFCVFCKGQHHLVDCASFGSETLDARRKFIRDHGLCYGCLKSGHLSKDCKRKSTCSSCKRRHPTVLHDDNWKVKHQINDADSSTRTEETQTSRSHASVNKDTYRTSKTSMIVPVWLSHESTQGERLVYAMLDSQSDTSFILERTKDAMGIEGTKVNLLLSTMTLANERISSEKISGLKVRAFNGTKEICLPPTFTRSIMPANRDHIPTPDTARAFPHLNDIAQHMTPLKDCEIGLLIGYDCASALAPRAVIVSPDENGPFGLQTDLGWSIVGMVESSYQDCIDDRIGSSHRVMVHVLPEDMQREGHPSGVMFSHRTTVKEEIVPHQVLRLLEADFSTERKEKPYSQNDVKFMEKMAEQIHVNESGHYEMPLPFQDETPALPNNRFLAEKRLDHLWNDIPEDMEEDKTEILANDPEVKRTQAHVSLKTEEEFDVERLSRFSSWHQTRRAVANCLRLKSYLHRRCKENHQRKKQKGEVKHAVMEPMSAEHLILAEKEIIKHVQRKAFRDEIQMLEGVTDPRPSRERRRRIKTTSRLHQLDPFLDSDGILRVGGRLRKFETLYQSKYPAILPQSHLTEQIVAHCHAEIAHQGRGMTINCLRSKGYWILGCSNFVAKFISRCVTCRRLRRPPQTQKMADLPKDRVTPDPPFTYCGVDCFGPWIVKEGRKEVKRYGLLFTCMSSRAIHIETLKFMTTDAFINALRRFISVRGPIRQLRSDRGTNFIGAENEFAKAWKQIDHEKVKSKLLREECDYFDFTFNFPSSSHMGGAWECQIGSVRRVLEALLYQNGQQLDDDALRTLLCEAAAIVNSRPLSVEFLNEPNHPEPLTPNHLLTQKSRVMLPPPGSFPREDVYAKQRWRRVQHLANEFWIRWRKEFLNQLQARQKWTVSRRDMKVGDIAIIKDDNAPRNTWSLGRIAEAYESDDNHVRKVKVAVGNPHLNGQGKRISPTSYLDRPIHKLVLLIAQEDQVKFPAKEPVLH